METFKDKILKENEKRETSRKDKEDRDYQLCAINSQDANTELIMREVRQGFKPKWFVVLRMSEPDTPKILNRRKEFDLLEKDILEIKDSLYSEIYNKKWKKKRNRVKSIWGIEYQANTDNPHINLLIEDLPYPYDTYKSAYVLMDRLLPKLRRSISFFKNDIEIKSVWEEYGISSYISKESDFKNSTILHRVSDFYNDQLELPFETTIQ